MARAPIMITTSGHFNKSTAFLNRLHILKITSILERYGAQGVAALSAATPQDTGLTAASWSYSVGQKDGSYWIDFHNSNLVKGIPVVVLIQYGHGTRNGGYVVGRDFINPALASVFESIKNDVWKEVSKA